MLIERTNTRNWVPLSARLAIFLSIFPHGAQKLFGWFGGAGFSATMEGLSKGAGLPMFIVFLVIIIESIATLFLLIGFLTRISAAAVFINFLGVVFTVTIHSGYFMNWKGEAGKGEGLEFFILLFALLIILLIRGGGKFSLDALLFNRPKTTLSR